MNNNATAFISLDCSHAFQSLSHPLLLHRLEEFRFPATLCRLVKNYLSEQSFVVRVGGDLSPPAPTTCGVPQGSELGPLLFVVFTAPVVAIKHRTAMIAAYADEIGVYASSMRAELALHHAQAASATIVAALKKDGIRVNPAKTDAVIMSFQKGKKSRLPQRFVVDGEGRNISNNILYLGVTLDRHLTFSSHARERLKLAWQKSHRLYFTTDRATPETQDIQGHHTKMMVFRYTDKSVRIIVHTANLLEDQWKSYTQGLWISPKCPPLPPDTDPKVGDSTTNFKHDVLHYLSSYKVSELQPWLEILKAVDMSDVKVFFIASIPGMHTTDDWGQLKMGKILKEHIVANDGNIIAQYSVIGSLGPEPSSWFPSNMLSVFTSSKREWWRNNTPQIKFIYPTQKCVSKSYDKTGGYVGYPKETRAKQEWVLSYMWSQMTSEEKLGTSS
ncbi:uncharacterized protein [Halyomorpha halys]|uniref:uncharacterized protein isoform X3 n=1 Tax=Halyomorpha halys TaxID=286706 RepID=UPI0034D33F6C